LTATATWPWAIFDDVGASTATSHVAVAVNVNVNVNVTRRRQRQRLPQAPTVALFDELWR
jgi:hypothetical protein